MFNLLFTRLDLMATPFLKTYREKIANRKTEENIRLKQKW